MAQLMTFSRKGDAEPELLDVNEVVNAAMKLWSRALGEDIELRTELEEGLPPIRMDPIHLDQILMNLVVNARDAMPRGGRLTISTFGGASGSSDHKGVAGHVSICVADTGSGMDRAIAARIFDPFFSTKPRDSGTGLGLATVHGIVKQALGWIELETAPEQGSSFRIYLPVAEEPTDDVITLEDAPRAWAGSHEGRVLVVEDDVAVCRVVERILRSAGYKVRSAHSAPEALDLTHNETFDLVLCDVILPGMSGPELARVIRDGGSRASIAFMSGYPDQVLNRYELPVGAPLIQKPFTGPDLLEIVTSTLGEPPSL